jgi:hypothetical protein
MKLAEKRGFLFTGAVAHMIIWGVLFTFPLLFTASETPVSLVVYLRTWIPLFFSAFIFYINYHFLIDSYLFRERISVFIGINFVLIVLSVLSIDVVKAMLPDPNPPHPAHKYAFGKGYVWYKNAFSFLLTSGVSVALRATQRWMRSEAEKKDLENAHLKSEITHLHYQLQPHFFFNALNNIYSLIDSSPATAKEAVHGLAKLMRYILYETPGDRIPLSKEIAFLQNYIRLMEIRLPAHVKVSSEFPVLEKDHGIAPLLFITLVENAFKHGVSITPSVIRIRMETKDDQLVLLTENAVFPKQKDDKSGSGIGLGNLQKRLQLLYPGKFELKQEATGELYSVSLTIHL